jgi:PAS domain S-box-containing protein
MNKTDKAKQELSVELEKLRQENAALKIQHEKDISERLKAQESLTDEKNLLRSLMNNIPDKIYFKDINNRFKRISNSLAILFKLNEPEQAYGKTDFDFFTEEHARTAFETELEIMKTGLPVVDLEEKETWPDGKETWVSTTKLPLLDNDGNIIGTFGISRDITEHKLVETELEKHRNHLEELVQQRTLEWNNAYDELQIQIAREKEVELMLEQSLEKEKELSEMQSRFISTTSHEFRTPLAAVLSSTELLQRYSSKWDENKKNEHYNRIIESTEYLTKLLDDVLTISRTESGKTSFKPESVDLFKLISECEKDHKSLLTEKHEFRLNYNLEEKKFQLDRKLIRFIFSNLLSNAIKYSPAGGIIGITLSQNQQQLIIEFRDEGIGIPPEEVLKIFDSFYRSKNTGTIEGTGLGLAIVKRAVNLHSGEITVKSELNKGTIFNVKIPLIVA